MSHITKDDAFKNVTSDVLKVIKRWFSGFKGGITAYKSQYASTIFLATSDLIIWMLPQNGDCNQTSIPWWICGFLDLNKILTAIFLHVCSWLFQRKNIHQIPHMFLLISAEPIEPYSILCFWKLIELKKKESDTAGNNMMFWSKTVHLVAHLNAKPPQLKYKSGHISAYTESVCSDWERVKSISLPHFPDKLHLKHNKRRQPHSLRVYEKDAKMWPLKNKTWERFAD